jgi:hypothetical protein
LEDYIMAAWEHSNKMGWTDESYMAYRAYVVHQAESYQGRPEDCADLSMLLLIEFAADQGLAVTFIDNEDQLYISKAEGVFVDSIAYQHRHRLSPPPGTQVPELQAKVVSRDLRWNTRYEFTTVVKRRIGAKSLWRRNTIVNPHGPQAGDLLLSESHAGLVFAAYPPGVDHAKLFDRGITDFPGSDAAKEQVNKTAYFKGTVNIYGRTAYRSADGDTHFDYLNSRSNKKRNAELIYFANARQAQDDGFQFCMYGKQVLDNWFDWDGQGIPPRWPRWF